MVLIPINKFIQNVINRKIRGSDERKCPVCKGIITGERAKSWISFFYVVTTTSQLKEFDKWIRQELCENFYHTYGVRLKRRDFRKAELASLEQEYYKLHKKNLKLCSCELSDLALNIEAKS